MSKVAWVRVWRALAFERAALVFTILSVGILYVLVSFKLGSMNLQSEKQKRYSNSAQPSLISQTNWQTEMRSSGWPFVQPIAVTSNAPTQRIKNVFDQIGYRLENVRWYHEVPRVFLTTLPKDLPKLREPAERKNVFIMMMLPLVLHTNELILHTRDKLRTLMLLKESGKTLTEKDQRFLESVASKYGLETPNLKKLIKRVDIIPPSLALAQSAEESGWGTSRFAREGNALFGQRTWRSATGLVPKEREDGKTFKVRAFDHLLDGVKAYAHNLNVNTFYKDFREKRAAMRDSNSSSLEGLKLAATLLRYSERGSEYIKTIEKIIRINSLSIFDEARLLNKSGRTRNDLTAKPRSPDT
ncbi:MAG: hypothetical protein CMM75_00645 [Rhodospirillaceae bacterium]|nr:hypothetical protein [Rhodospirillaceae bacterium]